MKKWITAAVLVVSIVCFTGIAFAGVTTISQGTLVFPYKIIKPGSYQLQSNLTVSNANTTAILVQADNVTIDLNGFAILGPTVCLGSPVISCTPLGTGNGIDAGGNQNIKVFNGTVSGMGHYGILIGNGAIIESVRAESNGALGILVGSGTVSGNTATYNGGDGIYVGENGTVSGNTVIGNKGMGLNLDTCTAIGNTATKNGGIGIYEDSSGTVSGNTADSNGSDGIQVAVTNNVGGIVNGNTVTYNGGYGLHLGSNAGYVNNVSYHNTSGDVSGGFNLKPNLCSGAACP